MIIRCTYDRLGKQQEKSAMAIFNTRLLKPLISDGYITRRRLLDQMNANRDKPVQKVVAAAGYGKSILVSQWLNEAGLGHCWIALEEDCNDLGVFSTYLIEAVKSVDPAGLTKLEKLHSALELPGSRDLASMVINGLQRLPHGIIFVLDDYHTIDNREVHHFLNEVVNHFPEQHRLILISRFDPPLDLRKLRAYGKVHEVRMGDLIFSVEEIITLAEKQTGKEISRESAALIYQKTEGWIVPIRLWLKELSDQSTTERLEVKDSPEKSQRLLGDLLEDVFSSLDPHIRENLMLASLFPRFDMNLLRGIHERLHTGEETAFGAIETGLEALFDRSLFILALDADRKWYRFHHLVKEFLVSRGRRSFTGDGIATAIDYGCSYFASKDFSYLALQLSIEHKDYARAIDLFNRDRYAIFDSQRFDQFRLRLRLFPDKIVENDPGLLLIRALLHDLTKKDRQMSDDLERARQLLPPLENAAEATKTLWGEFYSSSTSLLFRNRDSEKGIQYAQKAMELMRGHSSYLHDHAMAFYVLALNATGKQEEARAFLDLHRKALKPSESLFRMNYHTLEAIFGFVQGKLATSLENGLSARALALTNPNLGILLMANYYIGVAHYQRNELSSSLQHLEEAMQSNYVTRPNWYLECAYLRCLIYLNTGEFDKHRDCMEEMQTFQKQFSSSSQERLIDFMKTEFLLRTGKTAEAWESWRHNERDNISTDLHYFQSRLTEAKLLMADHPFQDLDRAEELLSRCEARSLATNNNNLLLQTSALKVVWYARKEDPEKAMGHLKSLLSKTRAASIIRLYTDCGSHMQALFEWLADEERTDPYISKIASSFRDAGNAGAQARQTSPPFKKGTAPDITRKELQLLELISEGYQNKEIAEKLFYSLGTVKTYLYNLYQKIRVKNRAQAIAYFKEHQSMSDKLP